MSQFDNLLQQLSDSWIGKEILKVPDLIQDLITTPIEIFYEFPPIKLLRENTPFAYLISLIDKAENLAYVITSSTLLFMETSYAINKACNSAKKNLQNEAISQANSIVINKTEVSVYENSILTFNEKLDIPFMASKISELQLVPQPIGSPNSFIQQVKDAQDAELQAMNNELEQQKQQLLIERANATTKALKKQISKLLRKVKNKLRILFKIFNTDSKISIRSSNLNFSTSSISSGKSAIVPIVVGIPTILGAISVIESIVGFLISGFLLQSMSSGLAKVLSYASTSIVLKYFGSGGSIVARYFAANLLRLNIDSIPKIFRHTGMAVGSFIWLMAFAPYVIIPAIITILGMQTNMKTGNFLFTLGFVGLENPDIIVRILQDATHGDIYEQLKDSGEKLKIESGKSYDKIYSFSIDSKEAKPQYGIVFDLSLGISYIIEDVETVYNQIITLLDPIDIPDFS